ncbi:MAG: outer membrane beta-barrel protein [Pseudomonadota bacterium]
MIRVFIFGVAAVAASTTSAVAQFEFSLYGGVQSAPDSAVSVTGAVPENFIAGWDGKSFESAPYYGVRGTYWFDAAPQWGVSIDFTHAKVYADGETFAEDIPDWSDLEFSDGLNVLTLNAMRRFEEWNRLTPYVGVGAGVSLPHVDITRPEGRTFGLQFGGPAFEALAGVSLPLTDHIAVFGEYQFNYTINTITLDNGDRLSTDIVLNAVAAGVSLRF